MLPENNRDRLQQPREADIKIEGILYLFTTNTGAYHIATAIYTGPFQRNQLEL